MRRLAISNAEMVAGHMLGRYIDLTGEQEQAFVPRLKEHVRWIKETQLPILRRGLLEAENRLNGSVTETDVSHLLGLTYTMREAIGSRMAHDAAELAASMNDQQIADLEQYLKKSNETLLKRLKQTDEDLVKEQSQETVDFAENLAGEFSSDQQRRLLEIFPPGRESLETWLRSRQQLHGTIIAVLKQKKTKDELSGIFLTWATEPYLIRGEPRETWEARETMRSKKIAAFIGLLTPQQTSKLKEELADIAKDLAQ